MAFFTFTFSLHIWEPHVMWYLHSSATTLDAIRDASDSHGWQTTGDITTNDLRWQQKYQKLSRPFFWTVQHHNYYFHFFVSWPSLPSYSRMGWVLQNRTSGSNWSVVGILQNWCPIKLTASEQWRVLHTQYFQSNCNNLHHIHTVWLWWHTCSNCTHRCNVQVTSGHHQYYCDYFQFPFIRPSFLELLWVWPSENHRQ